MRKVCDLDVHKDSVFMCILSENGDKIQQKFNALTLDIDSLFDLPVFQIVDELFMESISVYRISIQRILESDFDLKLLNPYFIKQL